MNFSVLIVDDEENTRYFLEQYLTRKGFEVFSAATLKEARDLLQKNCGDIILLDIELPDGQGTTLLADTFYLPVRPPVIMITAFGDIPKTKDSLKAGAFDFLQKPINFEELEVALKKAAELVELRREINYFRATAQKGNDFIVGKNPKIKQVFTLARRAAERSLSTIIIGETGTGKEILAKFIHLSGPRAHKQMVSINCAAIQPTVLENELFGHEAGAYTHADKKKSGLLETADGGTLFLDEISSMNDEIQAKVLRVLETQSFRRVGGSAEIKVDVQIIAASNKNLPDLISKGVFRDDLYYRLRGLDLHLPPLRERREDIPELVGFFIKQNNQQMGLNIQDVTPQALYMLSEYKWPGNIRELRNSISRAMAVCDDPYLDIQHFPEDLIYFHNGKMVA